MKKILILIIITNLYAKIFDKEKFKQFFDYNKSDSVMTNQIFNDMSQNMYLILENSKILEAQLNTLRLDLKNYNKEIILLKDSIENINSKYNDIYNEFLELEIRVKQSETNIQRNNYQVINKIARTTEKQTQDTDTIKQDIKKIESDLEKLYKLIKPRTNGGSSRKSRYQQN